MAGAGGAAAKRANAAVNPAASRLRPARRHSAYGVPGIIPLTALPGIIPLTALPGIIPLTALIGGIPLAALPGGIRVHTLPGRARFERRLPGRRRFCPSSPAGACQAGAPRHRPYLNQPRLLNQRIIHPPSAAISPITAK
ncbi:hypothetical protein ABEO75_15310 [Paenibacillus macerans]|uniref:hypothetical protein n=1 Tax=Paenibacillus macerans TaxID=44252 RepID=UPI003D271CD2